MGRNKKIVLEDVEITDIGAEGNALARVNDKVVFVPSVIPGDIIDIEVRRKRKRYFEGYPIRFKKYSDLRIDPFCNHFGICGGCKWQHLPYEKQLDYKQKQVVDNLTRIGKVIPEKVHRILPSDKTQYYRNKLEFTFSNRRWLTNEEIQRGEDIENRNALGFHIPGMFDRILQIDHCYLQDSPSNEIRNAVGKFAQENKLSFYEQKTNEGLLRNIIIRTTSTQQVMVIVVFNAYTEEAVKVMNFIHSEFSEITSLMYVVNPKLNDSISDLEVKLFHGQDYIVEEMEGLQFKIGPKSFYQTNAQQAYKLYDVARKFASLTGSETVYDLYTGTGTIANFIARDALKVIGIEYIEEAIDDAIENSKLNSTTNTAFFSGDIKDVLTADFFATHGKPDVIITDPPRAGMHPDVVHSILQAAPDRIVYVSCNPATQARDIEFMSADYCVAEIQPVDMFPHTHHVENVALLVRNFK